MVVKVLLSAVVDLRSVLYHKQWTAETKQKHVWKSDLNPVLSGSVCYLTLLHRVAASHRSDPAPRLPACSLQDPGRPALGGLTGRSSMSPGRHLIAGCHGDCRGWEQVLTNQSHCFGQGDNLNQWDSSVCYLVCQHLYCMKQVNQRVFRSCRNSKQALLCTELTTGSAGTGWSSGRRPGVVSGWCWRRRPGWGWAERVSATLPRCGRRVRSHGRRADSRVLTAGGHCPPSDSHRCPEPRPPTAAPLWSGSRPGASWTGLGALEHLEIRREQSETE